MFALIKKLFSPQPTHKEPVQTNNEISPITATFDNNGLTTFLNGEVCGHLLWQDIHLIAITIEDDFLPSPYWYVGNEQNFLRIPNDAKGAEELFFEGFATHIPGYKNDDTHQNIITAQCAIEGTFIIWKSEHVELTSNI